MRNRHLTVGAQGLIFLEWEIGDQPILTQMPNCLHDTLKVPRTLEGWEWRRQHCFRKVGWGELGKFLKMAHF